MKTRIWPYPPSDDTPQENTVAKRKDQMPDTTEPFGKRLARLRKAAGHSQYTFADEVGISNRMVAYYEAQGNHPPTHLLPAFAKVLGVTTDQLLGIERVKEVKGRDSRLRRRIEEIEKILPPVERKHITKYLDHILKSWKAQHGKS
jgi:transcriptional regulator with XRE-family HTH domain